jgi:hypothetical protein
MKAYPEVDWKPWLFIQVPHGFWNKLENQRDFFKYAEKHFNIQSPEDWYQVTTVSFNSIGGTHLLA